MKAGCDEKRGQNVLEEGADTGFFMADESGEGEDIGDHHHQFPVYAFFGVLDERAGGFAVDVEQLQDGEGRGAACRSGQIACSG